MYIRKKEKIYLSNLHCTCIVSTESISDHPTSKRISKIREKKTSNSEKKWQIEEQLFTLCKKKDLRLIK